MSGIESFEKFEKEVTSLTDDIRQELVVNNEQNAKILEQIVKVISLMTEVVASSRQTRELMSCVDDIRQEMVDNTEHTAAIVEQNSKLIKLNQEILAALKADPS